MLFLFIIAFFVIILIIGLIRSGNWQSLLFLLSLLFLILYFLNSAYRRDREKKEWQRKQRQELHNNLETFKKSFYEKHERWLIEDESKFRHTKDYPDDWDHRRLEVYKRANGICSSCGKEIGIMFEPDIYRLKYQLWGIHVHHKIPLSKGGDNSFKNLELLCSDCHVSKHPNKKSFITGTPLKSAKRSSHKRK